jgi:hypothetical protein
MPIDESLKSFVSKFELLDLYLYLLGFLIPSIYGDVIESIFSLIIDILICVRLKAKFGKLVYLVFAFESFDIFDIFMGGDLIGLIEIIPFWYFLYKFKIDNAKVQLAEVQANQSIMNKDNYISEGSKDISITPKSNIPEDKKIICKFCGSDIFDSDSSCPHCGTRI